MVQALGIAADELMFIGELVDVAPDSRSWQGAQANEGVQGSRKKLDELNALVRNWEVLVEIVWDEIDAPYWVGRGNALQEELAQLRSSSASVEDALKRWEDAKAALARIEQRRDNIQREGQQLSDKLRHAAKALANARQQALHTIAPAVRGRLSQRIGGIDDGHLEDVPALEAKHRQNILRERESASQAQQHLAQRSVGIVSRFRAQWEVVAGEWSADLDSVPQYLDYLQNLDKEGLPTLIDRFTERLNRHTTQSLASVREKVESERDDIRERITVINAVLQRTEFRDGTYLRLQSQKDRYSHVTDFEHLLRQVFQDATANVDPEQRFVELQSVVDILDKASNPTTAGTLESLRLLDARYQMNFFAEEISCHDDTVQDVMTSSSGKSGGEKEAFPGTIVAASLAYVLTPEGAQRPVYCSVFLDEAFSNTAELVSRRVLRVFRELGVHVNLITPYKNLDLARESARSLIIAERDITRHESRLCEVNWETIDRRQRAAAERLAVQAEEHGIKVRLDS
ncbi:MAG: hypothetical protein HOI95_15155 [Chromatiales bacterium]|nr:hypothetical protein [Chromatiales bacterium]